MSKLIAGAILGGLGQGVNSYLNWKDDNTRFKDITAIQDRRAQEERDFQSDENRIARQSRGFYLPGEDGIEEYEKMFAHRLKMKEAGKAKNPQFSMPFAINGGANLDGVPQSVAKPPPPLDPTKFTETEFENMTDNLLVDYVGRIYDAMRQEDNNLSAQDVYAHLQDHNPNVAREVRALVVRRYTNTVDKGKKEAGPKRAPMPINITSNSLFSRSPSFAALANVPMLQHINSPEVTPKIVQAAKENYKITIAAEGVTTRFMGSAGANIITATGAAIPEIVQKLSNDRFVMLKQELASGKIDTMDTFYAKMRNLMGGNPTEEQMEDAFVKTATYIQPFAVMTGIVGNRQIGDFNPTWRKSKGESDRAILQQRSAIELETSTESLAATSSMGNVDITAASRSWT